MSYNNLKKGYNADAVPGGKRYEPPAWMLEPAATPKPLSGGLVSSSWGEEKATECPETRKLTLKQQAAALIAKGL